MSTSFPVCTGDITEDALGNLRCSTGWDSEQIDVSLNQLSRVELNDITTAVIVLFTIAFAFRFVRRFMDSLNAGRSG